MEQIFVGRQPILDRAGRLYGYELLHRSSRLHTEARSGRPSEAFDGDRVSADMLLKAVWDIGIAQLAGPHRAFINMTHALLMSSALDGLPTEGIVIEVLEDVPVDSALLGRLAALRQRGFTIALDDFVLLPEREALLGLADLVKLDVAALEPADLDRHVAVLKARGLRLLAEKVDLPEMHVRTLGLGFDLFQGYHFAKPQMYASQRVPHNQMVLLQLLARINDPATTSGELAAIIRGDVAMSITVLRWANGAMFGLRHPVESVERAIVVLGTQTLRSWASLLTLARMGTTPSELLRMLLVRARTCELLADAAQCANSAAYFTVGLLSALDVILHIPMGEALQRFSLSEEQRQALQSRAGPLGAALAASLALEAGGSVPPGFAGLAEPTVTSCYLSALVWADNLLGSHR